MLYLIDSSIYIFRAWQSLPVTLRNRFDEPANAVYGYADMLAHLLNETRADYVVCAFDRCLRAGIRHQIYPDYKADRPEAPQELQVQFDRCMQVADAFGLTALGSPRVEADDIIGQMRNLAATAGMSCTVVSADKDLVQFIGKDDVYWDYGRKGRQTQKELIKRFRIQPRQIPDWLALCGDKSDNIPGVPGVGPATAARLLIKWGTLDVLLQNLGAVADMHFRGAPRIARLLHEHRDTIHLARQLTGLIEDADLPRNLSALQRTQKDASDMVQTLFDLGFAEPRAMRLANLVDALRPA